MKILFIIDSLRAGGKERQLVELLNGLSRYKDIECELAVMSKDIHYNEIFNLDINIHYLIRRWKKDPIIFLKLYKICKEFKPDIIHSWDLISTLLSIPLAKYFGIKLINSSLRGSSSASYFTKYSILSNLSFIFSDIVISNSMAGLKARGKKENEKFKVVRNGFNFDRIKKIGTQDKIRKELNIITLYIVGMVSTFREGKDYNTFFKAAKNVVSTRKDVTFIAVGDGPQYNYYLNKIEEKYKNNIRLIGKRIDVESIINIFDIGILTSFICNAHGEGISNSIMEYMALGKPVIATNCGGNPELVINNVTGFLVTPKNLNELVNKINYLLDNENVAVEMGKAGKLRIEKDFSSGKMVNNYLDIYKNMMEY